MNPSEINFLDYIKFLLSKWKKFVIIGTTSLVIAIIYYVVAPSEFESEVVILPELIADPSSSLLKEFGGLAGITLPVTTESGISVELYPSIINTYGFYSQLLDQEFYFEQLKGKTTLNSYFENYHDPGLLSKSFGLILSLKELILGSSVSDSLIFPGSFIYMSKEEAKRIELLQERILVSTGELGLITIEVKLQDQYACSAICQYTTDYLINFVQQINSVKQQKNLNFLAKEVSKHEEAYKAAQERLLKFRESNLNANSSLISSRDEQLKNEYDLAYSLYKTLLQQEAQAKINLEEVQNILKIFDPAKVPYEKSEPKLLFVLVAFLFIGLTLTFSFYSVIFFYPLIQQSNVLVIVFFLFILTGCKKEKIKADLECIETESSLPNVIIFLVDDLGKDAIEEFNDLLPRINQLKSQSISFNTCYATPICTPSRVELLTGMYPASTGWVDLYNYGQTPVDFNLSLVRDFKALGYTTGVVGKWHMASLDIQGNHPFQFGFDYSFIVGDHIKEGQSNRYWDPIVFNNGNIQKLSGEYGPNLCKNYASQFVSRCGPFFLYYAFNLVHSPFIKPPENSGPNFSSDSTNYPLMLSDLDFQVGEVVDKLISNGTYDNTIIVFTTDNGTPRHIKMGNTTGQKGSLNELGINVPLFIKMPGIPAEDRDQLIDFSDILPSLYFMISGQSIRDNLDGLGLDLRNESELKKVIFSQREKNWTVRNERWKLYSNGDIVDLNNDPLEITHNKVENDSIKTVLLSYADKIVD